MEENVLSSEELRRLQLSELDILKEFKRLCNTNNLRYFITAGTLLGAIRHNGFIPWDDDIDVAMPRDDFDKLAGICKTQLADSFYYQDSYTEENYPYFFSKIRKENTEVFEPCLAGVEIKKGEYIDIFPLDSCPQRPEAAKIFFKINWFFTWVYQGKVDPTFQCGFTKCYAKAAYKLMLHLPLDKIRKIRRSICIYWPKRKQIRLLCTVGGAHGYPAETYKPGWFNNSVELEFEGETFSAPGGWHELLSHMYGDYMKVPASFERQGHFKKLRG